MTRLARLLRRAAPLVAVAAAVAACSEKLTTPGDCPRLCPGGTPTVYDTVLTPVVGADSSYRGYVEPGFGGALLVSNGFGAGDARALLRFLRRADSVPVSDTLRAYRVDSVALQVGLVARDSTVTGLRLYLYRVPNTLDTTSTFAEVSAALVPGNLVDSIVVADTVRRGTLRLVLSDSAKVANLLQPADSGVLSLGIAMAADAPTGIRIGSLASSSGPLFTSYVHASVADTARQRQSIPRGATISTFVTTFPNFDTSATALVVGGAPSARSILRFALPERLRDSAQVLRATLELLPTQPVPGLRHDDAVLQVQPVLSDLGAKSPLVPSAGVTVALPAGTADTVRLEVARLVRLWQGSTGRPPALFLGLLPEASTFTQFQFGSSRGGPLQPRLRISYVLPFSFEAP